MYLSKKIKVPHAEVRRPDGLSLEASRTIGLAACFAGLLSAATPSMADPNISSSWNFPSGTISCSYPNNSDEGYERAHRDCVEKLGGLLRVTETELVFDPPNGGRFLFLRDRKACEEGDGVKCIEAQFIAYNAAAAFAVVYFGGWEWDRYSLIDLRSGVSFEIGAAGVFSPSGRHVAVVDGNLMNDPEQDIVMFDLDEKGVRQSFAFKSKDNSSWTFLKWQDDRTILVQKDFGPPENGPKYRLRNQSGKWTLSKM